MKNSNWHILFKANSKKIKSQRKPFYAQLMCFYDQLLKTNKNKQTTVNTETGRKKHNRHKIVTVWLMYLDCVSHQSLRNRATKLEKQQMCCQAATLLLLTGHQLVALPFSKLLYFILLSFCFCKLLMAPSREKLAEHLQPFEVDVIKGTYVYLLANSCHTLSHYFNTRRHQWNCRTSRRHRV